MTSRDLAVLVNGDQTPDPTVAALGNLQSLLWNVSDVEDFLQQVAELAAEVVDPPGSCGINAHFDGLPLTVVSSDQRAARLDESQFGLDDGPCVQAMHSGHTCYVQDVATEQRWPDYIGVARTEGLRSSLSLPLIVRGQTLGSLNMFAFHAPHAFDAEQQQRLSIFAAQAAGALQLAVRRADDNDSRDQLQEALTSRAVIDQALGILMAQQECTAPDAFTELRHRSENTNRKLRDVAADIVEQVSGRPPHLGRPFQSRRT